MSGWIYDKHSNTWNYTYDKRDLWNDFVTVSIGYGNNNYRLVIDGTPYNGGEYRSLAEAKEAVAEMKAYGPWPPTHAY